MAEYKQFILDELNSFQDGDHITKHEVAFINVKFHIHKCVFFYTLPKVHKK